MATQIKKPSEITMKMNEPVVLKLVEFNIEDSNMSRFASTEHAKFKFTNRVNYVTNTIKLLDPDIFLLLEARNLEALTKNLSDKYILVSHLNNADPFSLKSIIGYNSTKVFLVQTRVLWFSDNGLSPIPSAYSGGNGYGRSIICAQFYPVFDKKIVTNKPFWFVGVHFALGEEEKYAASVALTKISDYCPGELVITGDFNTFIDKPNSVEQINVLSKTFKHVENNTSRTFFPFPCDKYYDIAKELHSVLDHWYISTTKSTDQTESVLVSFDVQIHCLDNTGNQFPIEDPPTNRPSDHFPTSVRIVL